jgi:hypothetical protein
MLQLSYSNLNMEYPSSKRKTYQETTQHGYDVWNKKKVRDKETWIVSVNGNALKEKTRLS